MELAVHRSGFAVHQAGLPTIRVAFLRGTPNPETIHAPLPDRIVAGWVQMVDAGACGQSTDAERSWP